MGVNRHVHLDAGGEVRSAPAGDLGGRQKSARSWSRLRERSSFSSRTEGGYSFSMRLPRPKRQRVRSLRLYSITFGACMGATR